MTGPPRARLRLDPWPAEYEAPIQIASVEPEAADVDPRVERADWIAVRPASAMQVRGLYFVDGVRRVEARVLAGESEVPVHGLFGSAAAGCVRVEEQNARFDRMVVERFLVLGQGVWQRDSVRVGSAEVVFEAHAIPDNSPADALDALQKLMRSAEARLGDALAAHDVCVFQDGPLSYLPNTRQDIIGVIKRIHLPYLAASEFALVGKLEPGERTPLFLIRDSKCDRYSCFVRLARGRTIDHALAGIVRLEMAAALGIEKARALADLAALRLPAFASTSMRDDRAPQNLLPVGALEQELRRRLGDPLPIRRAIERHIQEGIL